MKRSSFIFYFSFFIGYCTNNFAQQNDFGLHVVNNRQLQDIDCDYIFPSNSGKLWLCTTKGLVSFDGSNLQIFSHKNDDNTTISENKLHSIAEDELGNLYIGTYSRGVDYFNSRTGKSILIPLQLTSQLQLASNYIVFYDGDGILWIGVHSYGFAEYNPATYKQVHFNLDASKAKEWSNRDLNSVTSFASDPHDKNILWLGTFDGIYSFNKTTHLVKRNFHAFSKKDSTASDNRVEKIDMRNNDTIWFGTSASGFGWYDIKTGNYQTFIHNKEEEQGKNFMYAYTIRHFCPKDDTSYYVACDAGPPAIFSIKQKDSIISRIPNFPKHLTGLLILKLTRMAIYGVADSVDCTRDQPTLNYLISLSFQTSAFLLLRIRLRLYYG